MKNYTPKERYDQEMQKLQVSICMIRNRYSKSYDEILEDLSIRLRSSKFIKSCNQAEITHFSENYKLYGDEK